MRGLSGKREDGTIGFNWADILAQDAVWIDRAGVEHDIASMDQDRAGRTASFLHRRAPWYEQQVARQADAFLSAWGFDPVDMAWDEPRRNPYEWMKSQPCYRALKARAEWQRESEGQKVRRERGA